MDKTKEKINTVELGGWSLVKLDRKNFAELMLDDCVECRKSRLPPKLAFSMNGQALSLARTNSDFKDAMKKCDYIQADGQSLVIASKFFSKDQLPERIATTDFFHDAASIAEVSSLRFFFLGAKPDVLEEAINNIRSLYPDLVISGYRDGYFSEEEIPSILEEIKLSGTDVLWLGLGKPKEQLFAKKYKSALVGVGWIKTCGGLFDFLAGHKLRAPKFIQTIGLEWAFRLIQDPKRLFWRYFYTNIHAIMILIFSKKNKN